MLIGDCEIKPALMSLCIRVSTQIQVELIFFFNFSHVAQIWALEAGLKEYAFCSKLGSFLVFILTFLKVVAKGTVVFAFQEVWTWILC